MLKKIIVPIMFVLNILSFSYEIVKINNIKDVVPFGNKTIKPIVYIIEELELNNLEVSEKKKEFVKILLPSILIVKEELSKLQLKVAQLKLKKELTEEENNFLKKLYLEYKVENDIDELIRRLNTVPVELALAQAVIESGWGTSRFFKEGNNCYGTWTYRDDLPRIESKSGERNGKKVYLRKYESVKESVENYFYNLSVSHAYIDLRKKLEKTDEYRELTKELVGYSETGNEYSKYLNSVISYNKFISYREYKLEGESQN